MNHNFAAAPDGTPLRVLVTAPTLADRALQRLAELKFEATFLEGATPQARAAELSERLHAEEYEAIISRTLELPAELIAANPVLKVISRHGAGYNTVDIEAATARGIPVFTTPGLNSVAVAELSVGLLLAAARRIPYLDSEVKHGRWTRFQGGTQLAGRTLGVIGFGNIGQRVAKVALALGMEVVGYDPVADVSAIMPEVHAAADLDELLPRCDAISLHVPLLDSTVGLIGRRELSLLRAGAILVNTARSPIVDEPALVEALTDGRLAAAGLDLTEDAALPADHPLRVLDNVVLTPHIGGSTQDALDAVAVQAVDNVYGYLTGTLAPSTHCVNPETLDEKDRVTA